MSMSLILCAHFYVPPSLLLAGPEHHSVTSFYLASEGFVEKMNVGVREGASLREDLLTYQGSKCAFPGLVAGAVPLS